MEKMLNFSKKKLKDVDDQRIFAVAEALRQGISEKEIHDITKIDLWFIDKIKHLVEVEKELQNKELSGELLKKAKRLEFPNQVIAKLTGKTSDEVKNMCQEIKLTQCIKWLIHVRLNLMQQLHIIIQSMVE